MFSLWRFSILVIVVLLFFIWYFAVLICFKLQADALVCSVGATSQAIIMAGVPRMTTPNAGEIAVFPGSPLANHVINTHCEIWNGGQGEAVSVFFVAL